MATHVLFQQARRQLFSQPSTSIAVVGSGPAGFYFTDRIARFLGDNVHVDIIEELPTPFGLVRSGVAPDHPDTKNVINKFSQIASRPGVRFFGNVSVGSDVTVAELRKLYSCVVLAQGAASDRRLDIPGEDAAGCLSARQFVNWYNGHPQCTDLALDLSKVQRVGIIGLGNVALDCARILLKPPAALHTTDITAHALRQLERSAVSEVHIVGRRGPVQAQFSGKELREVLTLGNVSISMHPARYVPTDADMKEPRKSQKVRHTAIWHHDARGLLVAYASSFWCVTVGVSNAAACACDGMCTDTDADQDQRGVNAGVRCNV